VSAIALRPSFFGEVRGETLKLRRQLSFWLVLAGGCLLLGVVVLAISGATNNNLKTVPATVWAYNMLTAFGTIFQIGSGIFLLLFGSRLIGMEYSSGTIRILYARGAGRLRLLLAKIFTLCIVAVCLLAGYALIVGSILAGMIVAQTGSLDAAQNMSSEFWGDLGRWTLVQGISMGMAILIAAAAAGLGRSLAFAIAASLAFYPADNFLNILEILAVRATGHDQPWVAISQYQLGTNLNILLTLIEPHHLTRPAFAQPLAPVDATHAAVVIGVFALAFALIALYRTLRPDVLE
jgi:ABC-type transport system involved in multi-copper enzyme maturation permease subunit